MLFEQISSDIVAAMKAKDKVRLLTLRNVKKYFIEAKTAPGSNDELTDEAAMKVLAKLAKQGRDTAQIYLSQNRADLAEEEMKQAIKDFESYFVEQILKNVQESLKDDEDSSNAQLTEFFMGQVGEQLADKIVDQSGNRLTQTLYEQMCRNYNIKNE